MGIKERGGTFRDEADQGVQRAAIRPSAAGRDQRPNRADHGSAQQAFTRLSPAVWRATRRRCSVSRSGKAGSCALMLTATVFEGAAPPG